MVLGRTLVWDLVKGLVPCPRVGGMTQAGSSRGILRSEKGDGRGRVGNCDGKPVEA